jgi:SRSO17 transposase
LSSRFARVRVRVAHRDYWLADSRPEKWLLIEWPEGKKEPTKYWLSTLPKDVAFRRLVDIAKLRWRIERDYQELKQEVGLGHFEGRGWRGFHHHATLCIGAYGFLISERETIPPHRSCHQGVPAICPTRRLPAQRIRRCGLNATFRTRLQRCDGDWWPLSPRRSRVAHAAPLGTDTKICDTVRLAGC